jgi:hypothetical protein
MDAADPIGVSLLVAAAIERAGGAYFVGGSLASSLQGEPRSTNDVDVVISLPLAKADDFVEGLGSDFEVDRQMLRDALRRRATCNIYHLPSATKVDLFAVGQSPFDEMEFSRRRPVRIREGAETLVLKTPEDTVLRKLRWYEDGGRVSERQWRDIVQVLRVSGAEMDSEYLEHWARVLEVAALLEKARSAAT